MELEQEPEEDSGGSGGQWKKRDALHGSQPVPFSMFDPIVAFDAISGNWINVPEVAKLGIQAAHKKLGLAREERTELQTSLETLQRNFRGLQEHHVHQMNSTTSRLDFLEKSTKRKKKYRDRTAEFQPASSVLGRRSSGRDMLKRGSVREAVVPEESSDESSVQGLTPAQQELLEKVSPLEQSIASLQAGQEKEKKKAEALLKRIDKEAHSIELLENRLNDELSTRSLSLLFRQLIFTELPATLENFVGERMQGFKKMVDTLEKRLENEIAAVSRREQHHGKQLQGLADRLPYLEAAVQALQAESSSGSEDNQRELAREAGRRLFSPRVSGTRIDPVASAPVPEDPVDQALKELIMGNGPPLDDGPASPVQSDERAAFSPETATKEVQEPEFSRPEPEVERPSETMETASQELFHRKKPGRLRKQASRASPIRRQQTNLSDWSEDDLSSPHSHAFGVHALALEDALRDFVHSEKFKCLLDKELDYSFTQECVQKLTSMVPDLKDQQADFHRDFLLHRQKAQAQEALLADLRRVSELEETRLQLLEQRLGKVENFSERGLEDILASTEGRLAEFLKEAESERARLWLQMSVIFPRFIQEGKDRMTMSEARAYALDARMDHLEEFIVKMNSHFPRDMEPRVTADSRGEEVKVRGAEVRGPEPDEPSASDPEVQSRSGSTRPRRNLDPRLVIERFKALGRAEPPAPSSSETSAMRAEAPPSLLKDSKRQALEAKAVDFTSEVCTETRTFAKLPECETTLQNPLTSVAHRARAREADLPGVVLEEDKVCPQAHAACPSEPAACRARETDLPGVVLEEDEVCPQVESSPERPVSAEVFMRPASQRPGISPTASPRSLDEALSEVLDGASQGASGEVQLIRALNPKSPNSWLTGDAALGRVILGQDQPSRRNRARRR